MVLLEAVGDVFEEDDAEDDVLVLPRFVRPAGSLRLVGGKPELGLEVESGGVEFGFSLGGSGVLPSWHKRRKISDRAGGNNTVLIVGKKWRGDCLLWLKIASVPNPWCRPGYRLLRCFPLFCYKWWR